MVSPFIENGTLSEYLYANPKADRPQLVRTVDIRRKRDDGTQQLIQLYETADALAYLHRSGVIHGDVKAMNILVSDQARALLCDFGLTKFATSGTSTALKSAGSPRWQSPELWESNSSKTYQSDVYAFGMTIAEVRKTM